MYGEYYDMIILFGHVCFFSCVAPLTAVLVFIYVYIARFIDNFKFSNLLRVNFLYSSTGIRKYNDVIKFFVIIGALINFGIILVHERISKIEAMSSSIGKWGLFVILENIIIILVYSLRWNTLPTWFQKIHKIRKIYFKTILFDNNKSHSGIGKSNKEISLQNNDI